jgi:hypothetical protein
VRQALHQAGVEGVTTRLELVADADAAEQIGFSGSPTILIDGEDPFASPRATPAFACRIYVTPEGRDVAPSVAQLCDALERRRQ